MPRRFPANRGKQDTCRPGRVAPGRKTSGGGHSGSIANTGAAGADPPLECPGGGAMKKTVRTLAALAVAIAVLVAPVLAATGPLRVTYYFLPG